MILPLFIEPSRYDVEALKKPGFLNELKRDAEELLIEKFPELKQHTDLSAWKEVAAAYLFQNEVLFWKQNSYLDLWPKDKGERNTLNQNLLIAEIVISEKLCLSDPNDKYYLVENLADEFQRILAPTNILLLRKNTRYQEYIERFCSRKNLSAEGWKLRVHSLAETVFKESFDHQWKKFEECVFIERLRIYSENKIKQIVTNFNNWDSLLSYLRDSGVKAGFAHDAQELEHKIKELRKHIIGSLRKQFNDFSIVEDATHDALIQILQKNTLDSYRYEAPLPGWMLTMAKRIAIKAIEKRNKVVQHNDEFNNQDEIEDNDGSSVEEEFSKSDEVFENVLDAEKAKILRERLSLVFSTFLDKNQQQTKIIFGKYLEQHDSKSVCESFKSDHCIDITVSTVDQRNRKVRQRIFALNYILDADMPVDDKSMLEHVKQVGGGFNNSDEPTLQMLAALGRASKNEKTLGWALIALLLIQKRKFEKDSYVEAFDMIREAGDSNRLEERVSIFNDWLVRRMVIDFAQSASKSGYGFAMPAVWMLRVWHLYPCYDIINLLQLDDDQELRTVAC